MNRSYLWWFAVVLIGIDIIFFYQGITLGLRETYGENGALENTQAIILFITMLVFLVSAYTSKKEYKIFYFLGALFCFSFILRELDVEDFALPEIVIFLGSGYGRNSMLSVLWLLIGIMFFKNFHHYRPRFSLFLFSVSGFWLFVGGVFLILGDLVEKHIIPVPHYQFYEEILELNGYCFMLLSAIILPLVAKD